MAAALGEVRDMRSIRFGIVRHGTKLLFGHKHGALLWAPGWAQYALVAVWNRVACFLFGHDIEGPFYALGRKVVPRFCSSCTREWP